MTTSENQNATKKDIRDIKKVMATKKDVKDLKDEIIRSEVRTEQKFEDAFFKFKSELFDRIDQILKEVVASREERTIQASHIFKLE